MKKALKVAYALKALVVVVLFLSLAPIWLVTVFFALIRPSEQTVMKREERRGKKAAKGNNTDAVVVAAEEEGH